MRRLLSFAVVVATVGVAHPAAAQEALLQALGQGLNEEVCSKSRFAALQQLDDDIRSLEAATETIRSLYGGPGTGVRFSRQPDESYRLESDRAPAVLPHHSELARHAGLTTSETIVDRIGNTRTAEGLWVKVELDDRQYPTVSITVRRYRGSRVMPAEKGK